VIYSYNKTNKMH